MTAFALDENGDMFRRGGSLARVTGADYVVQKLTSKLRMYRGEWWLNLLDGIPWNETILGDNVDIEEAEALLKRAITETPEVQELTSFEGDFTGSTRLFTLRFSVQTTFGPSGIVEVSNA